MSIDQWKIGYICYHYCPTFRLYTTFLHTVQKQGKTEKINNSPCVSAAKIWSRSTWLSEKHISKHIQSIARAIVWELPLQRWLFLSVVNFEQSPSSWGRKKGANAEEKSSELSSGEADGHFWAFLPLDAKLTDIHKLFPIFRPALDCIEQDCPIHLGS